MFTDNLTGIDISNKIVYIPHDYILSTGTIIELKKFGWRILNYSDTVGEEQIPDLVSAICYEEDLSTLVSTLDKQGKSLEMVKPHKSTTKMRTNGEFRFTRNFGGKKGKKKEVHAKAWRL